jgi:hypothetical protein
LGVHGGWIIFHKPRLMKIYVSGSVLYVGRTIFALFVYYFIRRTFEAISSGVVIKNSSAFNIDTEPFGFWFHTLGLAAFALLFIHLFFGIRKKDS